MASKGFFNFVDTDLTNPNNYSPAGSPRSGDAVSVTMAIAQATGPLPGGLRISVNSFPSNGRYSALTLKNATIPIDTTIVDNLLNGTGGAVPSSLSFSGTVVNNGTITFRGTPRTVSLPDGTTLTNNGTINIDGASPQFTSTSAASFTNNGLVRVTSTGGAGQNASFGAAIGGTGTVTVSANSTLEIAALTSTETLRFVGGHDAAATVVIDQPSLFAGTIGGFIAGDTLTLSNSTVTSETYTRAGSNTGTLQLLNGTTPVAALAFNGSYTTGSFVLTQSGTSVQITTPVTDSTTGSISPATVNDVFRFFNTVDGTHFFTASVAERDTVQTTRPELTQESNGFGTLRSADASTVPVYRFFDTTRGTHFFTTSATERDQTIASRSDLTFESSATFLEHSVPQTGDVAVFRLFSTADGTHLYTGSATELASLTTPGGTSYRADLVSEGISFYAPNISHA